VAEKPVCKICKGKVKDRHYYWDGKGFVHKICLVLKKEKNE